jgi:uncharacterized protein (TIGR00369 family)
MEKIANRINRDKDYHCFACDPNNPRGLKMEFWEDGDEVISDWNPEWYYDGWSGIMHGGIMATLADELGEWLIIAKLDTVGVTTELNIKYRKPLKTTQGKIQIRGKILRQIRNIVIVEVHIFDNDGNHCGEANIHYYTYPKSVAVEKFGYRG